jgi:hypothetical protein
MLNSPSHIGTTHSNMWPSSIMSYPPAPLGISPQKKPGAATSQMSPGCVSSDPARSYTSRMCNEVNSPPNHWYARSWAMPGTTRRIASSIARPVASLSLATSYSMKGAPPLKLRLNVLSSNPTTPRQLTQKQGASKLKPPKHRT